MPRFARLASHAPRRVSSAHERSKAARADHAVVRAPAASMDREHPAGNRHSFDGDRRHSHTFPRPEDLPVAGLCRYDARPDREDRRAAGKRRCCWLSRWSPSGGSAGVPPLRGSWARQQNDARRLTSFPGSAWERTAIEALPRLGSATVRRLTETRGTV